MLNTTRSPRLAKSMVNRFCNCKSPCAVCFLCSENNGFSTNIGRPKADEQGDYPVLDTGHYPWYYSIMDKINTEHEPQVVKQLSLADFDRMFPDEGACKDYLVHQRWPNDVRCPRCGNDKVYEAGGKHPWH